MRIVSLLPSITEIVAALGLADRLVGITHECDFPPDVVASLPRVTRSILDPSKLSQAEIDRRVASSVAQGHSLYTLDEVGLEQAAPTLVFTQTLCDVCAVDESLVRAACAKVLQDGETGPRVVSLQPGTIEDVFRSIEVVAVECGVGERGAELITRLRHDLDRVRAAAPREKMPRVVFLEWLDPPWFAGHWVPELVDIAGGHDVLGEFGARSERVSVERIVEVAPEVVILGPCGFDLDRAAEDGHALWKLPWFRNLPAARNGRVYAVDANAMFSRPAPRVVNGAATLLRILHGIDAGVPVGPWAPVPG
jgi:iron complex transport system substrate-binding protein